MRIAVLGGGVAGVILARELSRTPTFHVHLLERNSELGGMHRSLQVNDLWYDIGAFLFDRDHVLLRTFPALYDHFLPVEHRGLSLTRHNTLDHYPLSIRGYVRDNGPTRLFSDLVDLLRCKFRFRQHNTLAAYMRYTMGSRLYQQSGLKNYIERLYAVPDTEIDLELALQRIPFLPQECGLRSNFRRLARELFDSDSASNGWSCYVRPPEGFPSVYRIVEQELKRNGVNVRTGVRIERLERYGRGFLMNVADAPSELYDLVISTIPVGTVINLIGKPTPFVPEGMNLISLCYRFQGDLGFDRENMLFNLTSGGDWKRINFFSPHYGTVNGDHYFVAECTARRNDPRDPDYMRHSFEGHIAGTPVLKGELKFQGAIVTENAYPFFRKHEIGYIESVRRAVQDFGILLAGQQGRSVYSDSNALAAASRDMAWELRAKYGYAETLPCIG